MTRAEFGDAWPFTVDAGMLTCQGHRSGPVLTFTDDDHGIMWALNGVAIEIGFPELDDLIWLDNPATGFKIPVGEMLRRAEALC